MLTVHKPLVSKLGNGSQVNFTVTMTNDITCSFAFDDSCGGAKSCIRNYVLITQGENELYNVSGLLNQQIKMIIGFAMLDNFAAIELLLEKEN